MFLAINATAPVQAQGVTYDITTTWYEPMTQPYDSVFAGSFNYDSTTHAVTGLQGQLSESMTGLMMGMASELSLNNQLANGDASHQYEWYDAALGGTFATVFLNTDSSTFATSYNGATGDGWSPQGGKAVSSIYAGYPTLANNPQNAYALIFVPDNLSSANPISLTWDESTDTGSLGLAHTAYADYTADGMMGLVGMTGTSAYIYGSDGTMRGVPLSEIITTTPEPSTLGLAAAGVMGLLAFRKKKS